MSTLFDNFPLNPDESLCPTEVFIRFTGRRETYFRGALLAIARSNELPENIADGERNHRPSAWPDKTFQSVLFISHLKKAGCKAS
jgi:hypothetical protein